MADTNNPNIVCCDQCGNVGFRQFMFKVGEEDRCQDHK